MNIRTIRVSYNKNIVGIRENTKNTSYITENERDKSYYNHSKKEKNIPRIEFLHIQNVFNIHIQVRMQYTYT